MLNLDTLFDTSKSSPEKPAVMGKWFEIQLIPDLVSGELLNIGVGFVRARTKAFSFRLLASPAALACLYGPEAREQFGFLLDVTRQALAAHGPSAQIGPQIRLGTFKHAQGESVDAIIDNLYQTMVTLSRRPDEQLEYQAERHPARSTESLRLKIRNAFRKNDPKGFTNYWRDEPVRIPVDQRNHLIGMQIWQEQGLFNPRCFGAIVSACYRNPHYRSSNLNGAYHDLTLARAFMADSKSKGGVFILRPEDDPEIERIDNEIDNVAWALREKFMITPYVEDRPETLKERALEFAY
jgi:hypothetical protein